MCPCCRCHGESTNHILRCPENPSRVQALKQLAKSLSPTEYHPVFPLLKHGFLAWLEGLDNDPDPMEFSTKLASRHNSNRDTQPRANCVEQCT
jgi:hypothetical protein